MVWEEEAKPVLERVTTALAARGVSVKPFPMRRHDERGWCIGHVLNTDAGPVVLRYQHTLQVDRNAVMDDEINLFVSAVAASAPTLSALPPKYPSAIYMEEDGMIYRVIESEGGSYRFDVVVG